MQLNTNTKNTSSGIRLATAMTSSQNQSFFLVFCFDHSASTLRFISLYCSTASGRANTRSNNEARDCLWIIILFSCAIW